MAVRLFSQHVHPLMPALAIGEALLSVFAVHGAALVTIAPNWVEIDRLEPNLFLKSLVVAVIVAIALTSMGLYQSRQRLTRNGITVRVALSVVVAGVGLGVVYFALPGVALGRGLITFSLISIGAFATLFRLTILIRLGHSLFRRRVLVFGAGERASALLGFRRRTDKIGYEVVGFVPAPGDKTKIDDDRITVTDEPLSILAKRLRIDEVVVAMDDRRAGFPVDELMRCKLSGRQVRDMVTFLEREMGQVMLDIVHPSWFIFSEGFSRHSRRIFSSRVFDILMVAAILVIALPIMLVAMAVIALTDGFPIFYTQTRVGLNGETFRLYKLRSMRRDAETTGAPKWATKDDDRVLPCGRFIRKARIDELPQLFNVLRGDMSIVGPRPERPEFVEALAKRLPFYHERHTVRPGLTGWAQVSYPYGSSEEDAMKKLRYDIYYVKNHNLLFDLMILLQTAEVVVWGKGAR